MKSILFLTQTYPRFAGDTAGPFIQELARGLVRGGDRVTVLTPHAEGIRASWNDDGVTVRSFRYAPQAFEQLGYSRSLDADERMKKAAAAVAPLYALGAVRALRRAIKAERADLVHAHWVIPNGVVAAPWVGKTPFAIGLHGSDVFLAERAGLRSWVRHALRRTGVLTGCSPELVARVCALGFPADRARVIPYGVDSEAFSPDPSRRGVWRQKLGVPEEAPLLVSVGRMATKKGYQVLIDGLPNLLARHPTLHLALAGAGDLLEAFVRATEPWRDRVHFPGAVLRDTLPDFFRAADGFVLPAVHDPQGNVDGLPNVILEAMASGLPVIATAISGIPIAITDAEHGFLVPEQDVEALGDAIDRWLADLPRGKAMGEAGRLKARTDLTWDAVARRYRAAYDLAWSGAPVSAPA